MSLQGAENSSPVNADGTEGLLAPFSTANMFGGGRLLLTDVRVASMMINHARHRALARLFGIERDQANLVTLLVMLMLAEATHAKLEKLLKGRGVPSFGDGLLAGASVRELILDAAGLPARDVPFAGTVLMIAVVGGTAGPATVRSLRALKDSSHRMTVGFHHRYGYIVDPGHWRQRRAQSREARGDGAAQAPPVG